MRFVMTFRYELATFTCEQLASKGYSTEEAQYFVIHRNEKKTAKIIAKNITLRECKGHKPAEITL